jgi:hypothetical protein
MTDLGEGDDAQSPSGLEQARAAIDRRDWRNALDVLWTESEAAAAEGDVRHLDQIAGLAERVAAATDERAVVTQARALARTTRGGPAPRAATTGRLTEGLRRGRDRLAAAWTQADPKLQVAVLGLGGLALTEAVRLQARRQKDDGGNGIGRLVRVITVPHGAAPGPIALQQQAPAGGCPPNSREWGSVESGAETHHYCECNSGFHPSGDTATCELDPPGGGEGWGGGGGGEQGGGRGGGGPGPAGGGTAGMDAVCFPSAFKCAEKTKSTIANRCAVLACQASYCRTHVCTPAERQKAYDAAEEGQVLDCEAHPCEPPKDPWWWLPFRGKRKE